MKGAREIIERAMNASGLDNVQTQDARDVIEALTAAGYRILAPGEVDRETVERCAEVADMIADQYDSVSLRTTSENAICAYRNAERAAMRIATAIRTLTDGGHDA